MIDSKSYQQLGEILHKYEFLRQKLTQKNVLNDLDQYTQISKELKQIEKIALNFQIYQKWENELQEWKKLQTTDASLQESAKQEIAFIKERLLQKAKNLLAWLAINNGNKTNPLGIIVEIRGAVGGREANIFAEELFEMYWLFCKQKAWKCDVLEIHKSEGGGVTLVIFQIKHSDAHAFLRYEAGVHRVQRVPKTESSGRIHTSTATVAVLEEKTAKEFPIDIKDLKIDTFRSSGAGGQHVNTTDSAVRITHIPTGMAVSCQEGRSQHDNKEKALKVLRARLFQQQQESLNLKVAESRAQQVGKGTRSEKIRTYNFLQNRVTDHRINYTATNIEQIMSGNLHKLLQVLMQSKLQA